MHFLMMQLLEIFPDIWGRQHLQDFQVTAIIVMIKGYNTYYNKLIRLGHFIIYKQIYKQIGDES